MKNIFQKLILMSGAGLATILTLAVPGNASVFYDLEFFDESGERVGTGEFSHEDDPFDDTINLCLIEPLCGNIPVEIKAEDSFFRVESFSSTVQGLDFSGLIAGDRTDLFWRPFDDELVASTYPCRLRTCIGRELLYSNNSWFDGIGRTEITRISRMTATEWETVLEGTAIPEEARIDASGTWIATRRTSTSIPEPTLTLGLLLIGALGRSLKQK